MLEARTRVPHTTSFCDAAGTHSRCMTAVCLPAENTTTVYVVCATHRTSSLFLPPPSLLPAGVVCRNALLLHPFVLACDPWRRDLRRHTDSVVQKKKKTEAWLPPPPCPPNPSCDVPNVHTPFAADSTPHHTTPQHDAAVLCRPSVRCRGRVCGDEGAGPLLRRDAVTGVLGRHRACRRHGGPAGRHGDHGL